MHRRTLALLISLSLALLSTTAASAPTAAKKHKRQHTAVPRDDGVLVDYHTRPEVQAFIANMVQQHGFVAPELAQMFARTRYSATIARLMTPTGSSKPTRWDEYRNRFIEPQRIRGGVAFWRSNRAALQRASAQYGVPEEIIVAIIGIETLYGRTPGNFRVIDALTTLSFDYPPEAGNTRAPFFRTQLEDYLLFARENGIDVFSLRGSYAGAIGMPQFMPTSWRRYAVDYDGDGKIDLRRNSSDVIGSVAHFLQEHGWVRQLATHYDVDLAQAQIQPLLAAGIPPQFTPEQLVAFGVRTSATLPPHLRLALIDLPNGEARADYVLGTQNFFAITRYNRSSFYAMAVIELAQTIRRGQVQAAERKK